MLLLPALITFSATVVTAAAVKNHHSILHYELDAVAYPSIPPSQFLLFTANATTAKSCADTCNKNDACKYFSIYEMLVNEETYCSYYKSSSPFGKLEHMKERHIKGFKGYQKIVHVKTVHGHTNGTAHAIKSSHASDDNTSKTYHHGSVTIATTTSAEAAAAATSTESHKHGKGGNHDDSNNDAATTTDTTPAATATSTNNHKHEKGGNNDDTTTAKDNKHGKGGVDDSNGDDDTTATTTTAPVATATNSHNHGKGGKNEDKRSIPVERPAPIQPCGMKCWATRVARGFKAFEE